MAYFRDVIPVTFGFCLDELCEIRNAKSSNDLVKFFIENDNNAKIYDSFCLIASEQVGPDSENNLCIIQRRNKEYMQLRKSQVIKTKEIFDLLSMAIENTNDENAEMLKKKLNEMIKVVDDTFEEFCEHGGVHF